MAGSISSRDGGTNPTSLQERAIGQNRLQDWVANKIRAKTAILLLETCESGALVGGYIRSRIDVAGVRGRDRPAA
jgi:hypothetical protein